jgi:hypothetical protein
LETFFSFFLGIDGTGKGDERRDVFLSHRLKHLLGHSGDLNGLMVWLDTCHSGVAAGQAATEWGQVGLGQEVRRYELLSADHRPAGSRHPDTLNTRANLAHFTGAAGDPGAARDQYTALLPIREEFSGPRHPDTLTARADLAHWKALASGSE